MNLKMFLKKLILPHWAFMIFLIPASVALVIYSFVGAHTINAIKYTAYLLSAYSLTVVCAKVPAVYRWLKGLKERNKFAKKYFNNPKLRVRLSLFGSVSLNIMYVLTQLVSGIFFKSVWFYALAAYYALLIIMRLFLLRDTSRVRVPGENRIKEFRRYRFCGMLLLLMNQALAVIVFYNVRQSRDFDYHYIQTIAMAVYTFTAMVVAMVNVVRYRRFESPLMSAAKAISLASAVVSLMSLETAVLSVFDSLNKSEFRRIMTASTGAAVCIFILTMAVYMIIHSSKEIRKLTEKTRD